MGIFSELSYQKAAARLLIALKKKDLKSIVAHARIRYCNGEERTCRDMDTYDRGGTAVKGVHRTREECEQPLNAYALIYFAGRRKQPKVKFTDYSQKTCRFRVNPRCTVTSTKRLRAGTRIRVHMCVSAITCQLFRCDVLTI